MANKKATHTVVHPKLYLAVEGKLQHVPAGTGISLTTGQAKKAGNKVVSISASKTVEISTDAKAEAEAKAKAEAEKAEAEAKAAAAAK